MQRPPGLLLGTRFWDLVSGEALVQQKRRLTAPFSGLRDRLFLLRYRALIRHFRKI